MYIDALLYIRNNSKICRAKLRGWCFLELFETTATLPLPKYIVILHPVGNYYSTSGDEHLILSFLSGEYRINTECIDPSLRRIRC